MKSAVGESPSVWKFTAVFFTLFSLTLAAYWPVKQNDFVNYDDNVYITENRHVLRGLNWSDAKWAFSTGHTGYAHPVTWLSHQLDYSLYGTWAGGHHLTSVAIHIVNSVLLFLLGWRMTRRFWESAILAGVFAVHPLHVESVAWVAERKDVLSGLFFFLTLHAYVSYAARPRTWRYLLVFMFFVTGILCKPMLVTLPFVLLLLDYWPLRRLTSTNLVGRLLLEKIPLLFVALAWGVVTFVLQEQAGAVVADLSPASRVANAMISYAFYLWKTVWPASLTVFYPYPRTLPWIPFLIATALLTAASVLCVFKRQGYPYLIVGWLWFVGMLTPVIGLIQSGDQARADRYTYLPQIGLCLAVIWGISDLSKRWLYREYLLGSAAAVALLSLASRTWTQSEFWRNGESLWSHALMVTSDNTTAHNQLADALIRQGRPDEAILQAETAATIKPNDPTAYNNIGAALALQGKTNDAMKYFEKVRAEQPNRRKLHYNIARLFLEKGEWEQAISELEQEVAIQPDFVEAHNNLGIAYSRKGQLDNARTHFERALELKPNAPKVNYNLAGILLQQNQIEAAITHLKRELQIQPNQPDALSDLGIALSQKGLVGEAIDQWLKTISVQPDNLNAQCNLAWVYATNPDPSVRDGAKALEFAKRANRFSGGTNPRILRLLAAAYAENGQFDDAIQVADKGAQLARDAGDLAVADALTRNVALYQHHSPLRDSGQAR